MRIDKDSLQGKDKRLVLCCLAVLVLCLLVVIASLAVLFFGKDTPLGTFVMDYISVIYLAVLAALVPAAFVAVRIAHRNENGENDGTD